MKNTMRRAACIIGIHNWRFTNVLPYRDTSFDEVGMPSVSYTKTCVVCGAHRSGYIYGCSSKSPDDLNPINRNESNQ